MRKVLVALLALISVGTMLVPALAVQPDEMLPDRTLEARARALSGELRCMVCQNQSIDDSDAPLARDLRILVRERLKAGDSDAQVTQFLTDRYGDFVLLRPRFAWHTALLWATPAALLIVGVVALFLNARRRRGAIAEGLTPDEEARIAELTRARK
jgi:cytochrome c-type biogenesis protein CcmH